MKKLSGGKTLAVVAVAGGAILASIAPVMADVSAQSPSAALVRLEQKAKLKALGSAIEVSVTYSCPTWQPQAYLYLNVSQAKLLGGVATGSASKTVACTGGFETVTLGVPAQGKAFGLGPAFAKVDLQGYPNTASDERTIDVGLF